jgi:YVTN family beta-propeller protein
MYNLSIYKRLTQVVCGLAALVALTLSLAGCGDTFRPIVVPGPSPGPDPGTQRSAVVLTQTPPQVAAPSTFVCASGAVVNPGEQCPGTMMQINVSGDTNSSGFTPPGDQANYSVGRAPVFATFGVTFPQLLWAANKESDSVTVTTPSLGAQQTISLPSGSQPVSLAITADPASSGSNDLVLTANFAANTVSFVDSTARAVRLTAPVGTHPVSVVGIPPQRKAYVVNEGDNTVSVISTADGSLVGTIPVGTDPVKVIVNAGAAVAYVVNRGSGDVTVINTANDTPLTTTIPTGAGASFAVFDPRLLRVYVANTTANTVTVIDASTIAGGVLRTVALPAGATGPVGVTALPDGSRFYTVNNTSNNVTVFDAQSFASRTTIPVGTNPVYIAASGDSARVYVANHDSTLGAGGAIVSPAGTTIIRTAAGPTQTPPEPPDSVVTTIPAPLSDPQTCTIETTTPPICARQQPVFIVSQ